MTMDADDLAALRARTDALPEPEPDPVFVGDATERQRFDAELRRLEGPEILAGVRNGAWLDAQDFPPLVYHLPGIIPEGATLLVGPPKVGKSWFVLSLALAAAFGGRALGLEVEARPVLYLALEDGDRRLQDRCRKLLAGEKIPAAFEYLTWVEPGTVIPTIDAWLGEYDDEAPLVILDTLGKVMPPALAGESSYQRDYRVGGALKHLADDHRGACLLTNHHDRKAGSDDFVDRVSGTHGLAGSADTVVVLAREREQPEGLISVTGRDVMESTYAVSFDGSSGIWSLDGEDLPGAAQIAATRKTGFGLDERARAVVAYVNAHPEGVRWKDVERDLGASEARYLSRLYEQERIDKAARGLYTPLSGVSGTEVPNGQTDTTDTPLGEVVW